MLLENLKVTLKKLFKRRKTDSDITGIPDPHQYTEPTTVEEYLRRGWYYYSRKMGSEAEADFKEALALDPQNVDAYYSLGLVFKAQRMDENAIEYFRKARELIEMGLVSNKARAEMLRRLSSGHINEISEGDWKLEEEIWQHIG
jgi:tetratricopeptide (TPR) repeat protein